jgi:hypothetical protein
MVDGTLQQSTIDLIITSKKEKITETTNTLISSSDHAIISFKRKLNKTFQPETITARNFNKFTQEKFNRDLQMLNWNFEEYDVNGAVNAFNNNILTCLDSNAPWTTFTPKRKSNPQISKETIGWIKIRDAAFRKAKKTKKPEDLIAWKSLRNNVVGRIRKDKKNADLLNFADPKRAWQAFNNLRRNNNSKNGPPEKLLINGQEVTDKKILAEEFNNFFIAKVTKLKEKLDNKPPSYDPVQHLLKHLPQNLPPFSLKPISVEEVKEALKNAKNTRSSGPDGISNFILKLSSSSLATPMTTIFNLSLSSGEYPAIWKEARILPLHKKQSKLDINNYRNINLVSKTGLIFEKLIHKQISDHFTKYNLFSKSQNAYIQGRSTATLCTTLYDRCCRAAHNGKFASILSVDLKAGYDMIDGSILKNKFLHGYKASKSTTAWLESYMSNRTQSVTVGKERSKVRSSASSLGQGSRLAPLLFTIAISDLPNTTKHSDVDIYADDVNVVNVDKEASTAVAKLQEDATNIVHWLHANKLCLAEGKSTLILTSNKERRRDHLTESLALTMDGEIIKQSSHIKVLGCIFSRDLTWSAHLHGTQDKESEKGLIRSLSNILGAVSSMQNCPAISRHMFLSATFMGKLTFGIETWGSLPDKLITNLQSLQNRAARLIIKTTTLSTSQKLLKLNWLPVKDMITRSSLLLLHKMKTFAICPYFNKFIFQPRNKPWDTIPIYNPDHGGLLNKSFLPRTILIWNQLPEHIRRLPPIPFKRAVTHLLRFQEK